MKVRYSCFNQRWKIILGNYLWTKGFRETHIVMASCGRVDLNPSTSFWLLKNGSRWGIWFSAEDGSSVCSSSYRLASLLDNWWRYFYRTSFQPFLRRTLSKWVQESSSNYWAVLAICPRTNKQSCHPPLRRVSSGSSLGELMHTVYAIMMVSEGYVPYTGHCSKHFTLISSLSPYTVLPARNYYYYPHFRDEETEAHRS